MKVVLADVEEGALVKAEKSIRALGADTLAVKTDVSNADDVKTLAEKTMDTFGAVHLLCNNAGVGGIITDIWEYSLADWKWILSVNLWGVIHGTHYFVPLMLKQNTECHIVNTASPAGLIAYAGRAAYAISKHGVVILSEILYHELEVKKPNIGVSVLCPGFIKTNISEASRNRPKELLNKPGEGMDISDPKVQAELQKIRQMIEDGMPPKQVSEIVFEAIKNKKFYILANSEFIKPMIELRMEDIIQERNPSKLDIPS
jgi:NAD(P)-dependent dehydrogenase (short-subunit alcohol dehydrogenase family)